MKLGLSIEPFKGIKVERIVSMLRGIGVQHIETNSRIIPKIDDVIPRLGGTTTTIHLPIFDRDRFDFGSTDPNYEIAIDEIIEFINSRGKEMNLLYTLSHPPEGPKSEQRILLERLSQIDSQIVLENIKSQTDEEFMDFYFAAKDYLGKQLAGHAIDAPHRYVQNWKTWLDIPKELLKEIVYVHISDCNKFADLHRPLGMAALPFEEFFEKLKSINYQGVILQELKPNPDEIPEILESCLHCVKPFHKGRYWKLKALYSVLIPIIQLKLNSKLKELKKPGGLTTKDLAYDYC